MKSKTKFEIANDVIIKLFQNAGFVNVEKITPLTAGEFNSAYCACADNKDCVLKIAPISDENTLTYEKNIMAREVDFYRIVNEQTKVKTPQIYFYDNSKKLVDAEYFIMEKLNGTPLNCVHLGKAENQITLEKIGEMVAQLHKIYGNQFGYVQNGLSENWYLAIKAMTENLISDCARRGKKAKKGEKLLKYIEKYKSILQNVESTYTHFDIWAGNIFYEKNGDEIVLTIIDTERSFWGDGIGDFVSIDLFNNLKDKCAVINGYNRNVASPLMLTSDEEIRFAIMTAYLALIVHTEKFFRYTRIQAKYMINISLAKMLFKRAFLTLEK